MDAIFPTPTPAPSASPYPSPTASCPYPIPPPQVVEIREVVLSYNHLVIEPSRIVKNNQMSTEVITIVSTVFYNLISQCGIQPTDGMAIYAFSNMQIQLHINQSIFSRCATSNGFGGAIHFTGQQLLLFHVYASDLQASKSGQFIHSTVNRFQRENINQIDHSTILRCCSDESNRYFKSTDPPEDTLFLRGIYRKNANYEICHFDITYSNISQNKGMISGAIADLRDAENQLVQYNHFSQCEDSYDRIDGLIIGSACDDIKIHNNNFVDCIANQSTGFIIYLYSYNGSPDNLSLSNNYFIKNSAKALIDSSSIENCKIFYVAVNFVFNCQFGNPENVPDLSQHIEVINEEKSLLFDVTLLINGDHVNKVLTADYIANPYDTDFDELMPRSKEDSDSGGLSVGIIVVIVVGAIIVVLILIFVIYRCSKSNPAHDEDYYLDQDV